jgi:uncharacterized protein with HEPN domain
LRLALDHARHAAHVSDMPLEVFAGNRLVRQCVAFDLVAMSELLWLIPAETRAFAPEIEWTDIRATRNRIVHEPARIKWATLFRIVKRDLPVLIGQLENFAKTAGGQAP